MEQPNNVQITPNVAVPTPVDPKFIDFASRRRVELQQYLYYLPNPDPVLRKQGKSIEVYHELSYDSHVAACTQSFKDGVKSLTYMVEQADSTPEKTQFFLDLFRRLDQTDETGGMSRMVGEILDARMYGYQPMEVMWAPTTNGYIIPVSLVAKPQEWFTFDGENRLLLLSADTPMGEVVPDYKFICPQYEGSYNNPYGKPVLSSVFWDVAFKRGGMKLLVTFAEKYGMPWVVGKHTYNEDKLVDQFRDSLDAMVQDAILVAPVGTEIHVLQNNSTQSSDIYEALQSICKANIAQAILSHTGAVESTAGRLGGEENAAEVREGVINSGKALVEQVMNVLIRWTCELNNWQGPRPVFKLNKQEDKDAANAALAKTNFEMGVRFRKEFFVETFRYDPAQFDVVDPTAQPQGAQFADPTASEYIAQNQIDSLANSTQGIDQSAIMRRVLAPVLKAAREAKDLRAFRDQLPDLLEAMDVSPVQRQVAALTFASMIVGGTDADQ